MRLVLDKTEAARRQLETAVLLWFEEGDPVAIHTLAAAGSDVLHGVALHLKLNLKVGTEAILDSVRPEHAGEVRRLLRQSQNFFKHADKDAGESLEFETNEADLRLLDACSAYRQIASSPSLVLWAFETYAAFTWAHHLLIESVRLAFPEDLRLKIASMPKKKALSELVSLLEDA